MTNGFSFLQVHNYFYKNQHSSSLFSAECIVLLHPGSDASFSLQVTLKSYGSKSSYPEAIKELFLSCYFFFFLVCWLSGGPRALGECIISHVKVGEVDVSQMKTEA